MSLKSKPYKEIPGGISAPEGFLCHAVSAGIKDPAKPRLDLGLIYSTAPCVTARSLLLPLSTTSSATPAAAAEAP